MISSSPGYLHDPWGSLGVCGAFTTCFRIYIFLLWLVLGWLCRHCVFIKCFESNNPSHSLHYPIFCRVCISIKMIGTQNSILKVHSNSFAIFPQNLSTDAKSPDDQKESYEGLHHRPCTSYYIPRQHIFYLLWTGLLECPRPSFKAQKSG